MNPGKPILRALLIVTALWTLTPVLGDAVLVAPHAVFIEHRTRTAQVHLVNTTDFDEEVEIELRYGYPATDSTGTIGVVFPEPDSRSAAEWVRAFPRRVRVAAGQRQTVRLLATPPAELPDGEYWSRIIVTSRGAQVPVAGADSAIQAGVNLEIETIISLTYRKGQVDTGVELREFDASVEGDSLIAWMRVTRSGTAAYLGTARIAMVDSTGATAASWNTPVAVYRELDRRFVLPIDSVAPGSYRVGFELDTSRDDLDGDEVLPGNSVGATDTVTVGAR